MLTPEQRSLRAKIAANSRWAADQDRKGHARAGQNGLRAKFTREVREQFPDLSEIDVLRRAENAYKAHMQRLALKSSKARTARQTAQASGGDDG